VLAVSLSSAKLTMIAEAAARSTSGSKSRSMRRYSWPFKASRTRLAAPDYNWMAVPSRAVQSYLVAQTQVTVYRIQIGRTRERQGRLNDEKTADDGEGPVEWK